MVKLKTGKRYVINKGKYYAGSPFAYIESIIYGDAHVWTFFDNKGIFTEIDNRDIRLKDIQEYNEPSNIELEIYKNYLSKEGKIVSINEEKYSTIYGKYYNSLCGYQYTTAGISVYEVYNNYPGDSLIKEIEKPEPRYKWHYSYKLRADVYYDLWDLQTPLIDVTEVMKKG